jgi:hypothetical protein
MMMKENNSFKKKIMIVHIVRSEEVSKSMVKTIAEIVKKTEGPVEFKFQDEDLKDDDVNGVPDEAGLNHEVLPWSTLFGYCDQYRDDKNITDEELVVFLTDHRNERNWFSSWEDGKRNFFIQTSRWDKLIEAESCYPVIYELVTIPLFVSTCKSLAEVEAMAHDKPQGCPFDYCRIKTDVHLRLRTADVCPEHRKLMIERKLDPMLARQVFAILDDIRSQIVFRKQFEMTKQLSRLRIDKFHHKLFFTDIGNLSVALSPREITSYLFFMNHPEGVRFSYMVDHKEEIRYLYRKFCSDANLTKFNSAIDSIIDTINSNALSEIIASIKKKIKYAIGSELAENYTINFVRGEPHRIPLDRQLVTVE